MSPDVNSQGAALNEAFIATLYRTVIRSLIGMYSLMPGKV